VSADPCMGEVLSGGAALFFNSAICVLWSELLPPRRAEQRMGRIVRGSDFHSQRLDPLLRGRTEQFGVVRSVRPLWGRMVTICKCLCGRIATVSEGAGRSVTVSKRGGGVIIKAPV
jgi:hypothetical protein